MNGESSPVRFYVQDPHVAGLAVVDRARSSLVISSFGDRSDEARCALQTVAVALNAATTPRPSQYATSAYKCVYDDLAWRVIEHLGRICR